MPTFVGRPATALAAQVGAGEVHPREILTEHLDHLARVDPIVQAFRVVLDTDALAQAEALAARTDLAELPLAGVPVAVKDNVAVAGESRRDGSRASSAAAQPVDHEVVSRLRRAGAVVVGITHCPELCLWGATDGDGWVTRNPWDLGRTPGGSSGGSAAAVASAAVPLAHATDGLGSIRIPAADCGVVGIKPGAGVVPSRLGVSSWYGMAEHGPLATTAADAALMLGVLAGDETFALVENPRQLRIGLSVVSPTAGVPIAEEWQRAARETADLLAVAGHDVVEAPLRYPPSMATALTARWVAGAAQDARELDEALLQLRTRRHAALGRLVERLGLVRDRDRDRWRADVAELFAEIDVLLTPTLAQDPIEARAWSQRGWLANIAVNIRYAPLTSPWNLAGCPAASVPVPQVGGPPRAVQLVAAAGGERTLLALAGQLERLRPWRRHAPLAEHLATGPLTAGDAARGGDATPRSRPAGTAAAGADGSTP